MMLALNHESGTRKWLWGAWGLALCWHANRLAWQFHGLGASLEQSRVSRGTCSLQLMEITVVHRHYSLKQLQGLARVGSRNLLT